MPKLNGEHRLSQAERLALYYVAPRVASPFTVILLAAYGVVLLEALLFCGYGLWRGESPWLEASVGVFGAVVVLGVVIFVGRAVAVEVPAGPAGCPQGNPGGGIGLGRHGSGRSL